MSDKFNYSSSAPHFAFNFAGDTSSEDFSDDVDTLDKNRPFVIGVTGGSASGKTSVCEEIIRQLRNERIAIISMDSFYRPLTQEERQGVKDYNFDHPNAFDWELLISVLENLTLSNTVEIPTYDFVTHARTEEVTKIYGSMVDVILIEGILLFHEPQLLEYIDIKIFVDTDSDTRLSRRVSRDIEERGRSLESVLYQYQTFVKPSFDTFIFPTKKTCGCCYP
eukprot:TRINITY_DN5829_c0_g1_i1.p1 TRINITY_DN5829_c0_g1~~TRINITY_DN5829_c0_g1_i1.p1  ORF type:complete len:222 (-),score=44.35 TRINITY_DN5829_c0_g1_i1:85-750(-)